MRISGVWVVLDWHGGLFPGKLFYVSPGRWTEAAYQRGDRRWGHWWNSLQAVGINGQVNIRNHDIIGWFILWSVFREAHSAEAAWIHCRPAGKVSESPEVRVATRTNYCSWRFLRKLCNCCSRLNAGISLDKRPSNTATFCDLLQKGQPAAPSELCCNL